MASGKDLPSLRQVLLRLVLLRLFLPLMVLGLTAIVGVSYLGEQNLEIQQYQIAQSMAQIVDHHLDQGGRILDAVARVAENSRTENLSAFMKSTWDAYGYFETLYYLDEGNKVKLLMPSDPRYLGLDMSNLPDFQTGEKKSLIISRPFISIRTGEPTVYLIRPLSHGDRVIGELNLGLFQQEITKITGRSGKDFVFIMDQSGTLLAHSSSDLVKQQTNLSNLEIFHRGLVAGKGSAVYLYDGTRVLGSVTRVERTGWVVVDQVPLSVFFGSYAWILGLILLVSLVIWLTLVWNLRKQLQRYVITPLEQLSRGTNALAVRDFSQANSLSSIPTFFAELNKLATDFQFMSNNLQVREEALHQAKDELELQVEQRTQELVALNKELQQLSSLDGLTGIGNRRYLDQILAQEWQRAIRQETPVALILLDLDFFKDYNDVYGHQAGDDCLKQVAYTLKAALKRSIDVAARYGGEEFVAVLPETDAAGAAFLAEEIRIKIEALGIKHEKSSISKVVTVSSGIAAVVPWQGSLPSVIIAAADQALYNAKREGRNRVKIAESI